MKCQGKSRQKQKLKPLESLMGRALGQLAKLVDELPGSLIDRETAASVVRGVDDRTGLLRELLDLSRQAVAGSETAAMRLGDHIAQAIEPNLGDAFFALPARRKRWAKGFGGKVAGVVSVDGLDQYLRAVELGAVAISRLC